MSDYDSIISEKALKRAWDKVKKNKPAAGVDDITYEDFNDNLREELSNLHIELQEHEYTVSPVKLVKLVKESKLREVTLYTMRDKVVQASLCEYLVELYDKTFSESAYAYRDSKSAMIAISDIEDAVTSAKYKYVFKTDIASYFDTVNLERIEHLLEKDIKELDIIELIMEQLRTSSINVYGELVAKTVGIYQGASISPVLSNLYLREFDSLVDREGLFYIRYADDIIVLATTREELNHVRNLIIATLDGLGLRLHETKSFTREIVDGFEFLGYKFNDKGKMIPSKAMTKLNNSLEDVWLTMSGATLDEKIHKGVQILNGWEQYYRGERDIESIYEYVVIVHMMRDSDNLAEMSLRRDEYTNDYKEICRYLINVWQENKWDKLELLEYEQYFGVGDKLSDYPDDILVRELITNYSELLNGESEELWSSVMQIYADMGLYDKAERAMDKINELRDKPSDVASINKSSQDTDVTYNARTLSLYEEIFVGREDMYVREQLNPDKKRQCVFVPEPLTKDVVRKMFIGQETIGTYLCRNNDTAQYIVIDIDINRKMILEGDGDEGIFNVHLTNAAKQAQDIQQKLRDMGLRTYIEFSGYRGYHVWLFFTEWVPLRYVYSLIGIIKDKIGTPYEDLSLEYFPKKNKKKAGHSGQSIKLPYSIHLTSGKRSYMCNDDFTPVESINDTLNSLARYSMANIKKVIGSNISESKGQNNAIRKQEIVIDYESLGVITGTVRVVIDKCNLMKYLVNKSMSTGYLGHFERLFILHIFGHLGEDGKEFVHKVMSYTINYQYHVTQKFIERLPAKPVSCIKLRDQYKQITAEYGCSCRFKRTQNLYPSPVIHALRDNQDENHDITIPVSRTLSKTKQEVVYEELNSRTKVEELANKLVELKKQVRGIDKSVKKVEKELSNLFDASNVDSMEVEMGILIRQKSDNGYSWHIEI